jgi:hypothetical protein
VYVARSCYIGSPLLKKHTIHPCRSYLSWVGRGGGGVWAGVILDSTVNNMLVSQRRSLIHKNLINPKNCKFSSCFCKILYRSTEVKSFLKTSTDLYTSVQSFLKTTSVLKVPAKFTINNYVLKFEPNDEHKIKW